LGRTQRNYGYFLTGVAGAGAVVAASPLMTDDRGLA
jgi:hypothetical protein